MILSSSKLCKLNSNNNYQLFVFSIVPGVVCASTEVRDSK